MVTKCFAFMFCCFFGGYRTLFQEKWCPSCCGFRLQRWLLAMPCVSVVAQAQAQAQVQYPIYRGESRWKRYYHFITQRVTKHSGFCFFFPAATDLVLFLVCFTFSAHFFFVVVSGRSERAPQNNELKSSWMNSQCERSLHTFCSACKCITFSLEL